MPSHLFSMSASVGLEMACVVAERVEGWFLTSSRHTEPALAAGVLRGERSDVVRIEQELGAALGRERSITVAKGCVIQGQKE